VRRARRAGDRRRRIDRTSPARRVKTAIRRPESAWAGTQCGGSRLCVTMQVYVNGHEWLARQTDKRRLRYKLRYRRLENAFLSGWRDPGRAQQLADRFATLRWPAVLDSFARRVNPLLRDELQGYCYFWATHQAEYATDILFTSRAALRELYARLLRHAAFCLRAEDVLTLLGRKLHGGFTGEILNEWKRRWSGPGSSTGRRGTGSRCTTSTAACCGSRR
jgi:hypothetical protein